MTKSFDVVIVGGGVVGLTAALAMALRGFSIAVIDAGSLTVNLAVPDARVYAINQASRDLLEQLAVWQHLDQARISPYRQMHVWDAASGASIDFNAQTIAAQELGHILEESVLKQALLQQIHCFADRISLFPHHLINNIEPTSDSIQVSNEANRWQAQLLIVADGGNSPCRQLLKIPLTSWPYRQQAIVALVHTEKSHQQTAYQVFNQEGPLAFLPLLNEKHCSIVWSTTAKRAQQLMAISTAAFNEELTQAFAQQLGQVSLQGTRHQFPLIMRHAKQYSGDRWLLMGDAAHTIHPLAGLGLNVGLADLATWLNCLDKANNTLLSKKALSSYQRQRKNAVWQVIALMDGLKTLFTNSFAPVIALRGLGLRLCNRFSPLKRFFIEQAAGKIMD